MMIAELGVYEPNLKKEPIQKWVFTFSKNTPYKDRFVVIKGIWLDARDKMYDMYGYDWDKQLDISTFAKAGLGSTLVELKFGEK